MKTLKATKTLMKKENCFTFGQVRQQKVPGIDPTVIITTTVTNIFPQR